jgi:sugar phosphate isomerase/epimerase
MLLRAIAATAPKIGLGQTKAVRFGVRSPFPDVSLRERALLLRRLGYDGIELGTEWTNESAQEIKSQIEGTGIAVSAIVGSLELLNVDLEKRKAAVELDRRQLEKATRVGADCVIEVPTFGPNKFADLSPLLTANEVEEQLLIAELKQLANDVKRTGVTLLLEPCNRNETHFLRSQQQGASLIGRVGSPGFKLLSDFYYMQIEEKDIRETLTRVGNLTGYVHLADGVKRTDLHQGDHFRLLVGARFGRTFLRPVAPRSLRWGLLRPGPFCSHRRRRWRNLRGQTLYRPPDSGDCSLPVRELLYWFQIVKRSHARKAVPGVYEAGRRPFRSELRQLLRGGKRLRFVGAGRGTRERRDVVI